MIGVLMVQKMKSFISTILLGCMILLSTEAYALSNKLELECLEESGKRLVIRSFRTVYSYFSGWGTHPKLPFVDFDIKYYGVLELNITHLDPSAVELVSSEPLNLSPRSTFLDRLNTPNSDDPAESILLTKFIIKKGESDLHKVSMELADGEFLHFHNCRLSGELSDLQWEKMWEQAVKPPLTDPVKLTQLLRTKLRLANNLVVQYIDRFDDYKRKILLDTADASLIQSLIGHFEFEGPGVSPCFCEGEFWFEFRRNGQLLGKVSLQHREWLRVSFLEGDLPLTQVSLVKIENWFASQGVFWPPNGL